MYSVFLVEDEIVTREGIRNSIPWKSTPYTLAGEAPDGEIALPVLRDIKPDILITDIKMPFMDGLALARIIKRDQPWIKIIILSGHDEFEYAKEAISIGVEEYLLKPISARDMLASLEKVSREIETEKTRLTSIENLKERIKSSEDIIREKWLCDLITGQIKTTNAIETAGSFGIDLVATGYVVMVVEIFTASDDYTQMTLVKEIIGTILKEREDFILFPQSMEKLVILAKNISEDSMDDIIYTLAQGLKFETERNTACSVAIGIGSVVAHIGELIHSYAYADKAIRYMRMTGKKNIIGAGDLKWIKADKPLPAESDHLSERIRFALHDDIPDILSRYMDIIGEKNASGRNSGFFAIACSDIIDSLSCLIGDLQGNPREVIPEAYDRKYIDAAASSRAGFSETAAMMIERWIAYRDSHIHTRNHLKILKAKKYIDEEFARQDLSLNDVASHVNVSPNHFSTIFSQDAEKTFIEYLTSVRIKKARQLLLKSNMKVSDIAFEVGYNDPHYFSFIFKKNTGVSPREFRVSSQAAV
ncbi:MAG: response regulator [Spirochaetales bacterium]|nr:response regulator [Spirochaetales bacterium]